MMTPITSLKDHSPVKSPPPNKIMVEDIEDDSNSDEEVIDIYLTNIEKSFGNYFPEPSCKLDFLEVDEKYELSIKVS